MRYIVSRQCCLLRRDTDLISSVLRTTTAILRPRFDRQPISVVTQRHVTTHLLLFFCSVLPTLAPISSTVALKDIFMCLRRIAPLPRVKVAFKARRSLRKSKGIQN